MSETHPRTEPPRARRRLPVALAGLVLAFGLVACQSDDDPTDIVAPDALATTTTAVDPAAAPTAGDPSLGPDITRVVGTVADGTVEGTIDGLVSLPLRLDVASRGGGNGAVVNRASVDGVSSSLVWDGGRPVTLSGDAPITLPSGSYRLGSGIHLSLTDTAIVLPAGAYRLDGPHAVGDPSGLAEPSDATSFTTTDGGALSGTGAVEASLPPGTYLFLGPGRVDLVGQLTVQTDTQATSAGRITQTDGSFEVSLTVGADGVMVAEVLLGGTPTVG